MYLISPQIGSKIGSKNEDKEPQEYRNTYANIDAKAGQTDMKSLFARLAATISELKANPNEVLKQANGEPVVILSHNKPRAYMVPVETFEQMQEQLEDYRLLQEARKRMDDESIPVSINELRAGIQEKSAQGVEQA